MHCCPSSHWLEYVQLVSVQMPSMQSKFSLQFSFTVHAEGLHSPALHVKPSSQSSCLEHPFETQLPSLHSSQVAHWLSLVHCGPAVGEGVGDACGLLLQMLPASKSQNGLSAGHCASLRHTFSRILQLILVGILMFACAPPASESKLKS